MGIDRKTLESLRNQHGNVLEIVYRDVARGEHSIVIRQPRFGEYCFYNNHAVPVPGAQDKYELDPEVADKFLSWILVYPENALVSDIPAGIVIRACNQCIDLCTFENREATKLMYLKAFKNSRTIVGVIIQRLILTYGIDGYLKMNELTEEQIMELMVISEIIQGDTGSFAILNNFTEGLPFNKKRVMDVDVLLGIKKPLDQPDIVNHGRARENAAIRKKYEDLGMRSEEIDQLMNRLEQAGKVEARSEPTDGKIDLNREGDDGPDMSNKEYLEAKRNGKIMSYEESQNMAMSDAKTALEQKIAEDKRLHGDRPANRKMVPEDELHALFKEIKQQTIDLA